jgi:hypothetical protein
VQLDESVLLDKLETMCNYESPNGKWITEYDMVEEGNLLKLDWKAKVRRALRPFVGCFDLTRSNILKPSGPESVQGALLLDTWLIKTARSFLAA